MTDSEKLMYKIMGSMYQEQIPLVFKGALITKLILSDNSYNDLSRATKDIKTVDINKTAEAAGREIGNFNMFLSKQLEIEHAYGKLKGINGKPPFEDIYLHLKKFISPFLDKEKSMVWNSRTQVWYPDESRTIKDIGTIKDWKNQIDQEKQKKENKQYLREQQKNFPER